MARDYENRPVPELTELNAQLEDSIARCRRILAECKSNLAANDDNGSCPANDLDRPAFIAARTTSPSE